MSVTSAIRESLTEQPDADVEAVARAVMRRVTKDDLMPLVVDAVKETVRKMVRFEELDALSRSHPTRDLRRQETMRLALADLEPLLDQPYRIGDGKLRRFGALTAEEHRTRIVMLRVNISGLQRDVELHEQAVALIEAHGVSCLDEVGNVAQAA